MEGRKIDSYTVVEDDAVYVETMIGDPCGFVSTASRQLIMTKEAFIECYRRWILNREDNDGQLCRHTEEES